jgi:hypothetical protein
MNPFPPGRSIRGVTYFNLPNAAWDRRQGLHSLDFGMDLDFDGDLWRVSWIGPETGRDDVLNIELGSLRDRLRSEVETVDASSFAPWADTIGTSISRIERDGACILRLWAGTSDPIVIVAGTYLDDTDIVLTHGSEVLVVLDEGLVRNIARPDREGC